MDPIVLDRSRLEQIANCPWQGYLMMLLEAMRAKVAKHEVFPWEQEMLETAETDLIVDLGELARASQDSVLCEVGIELHALIQRAFKETEGDLEAVPEWFVDNLPKVRPDFQPEALVAGRHVADMLSNLHIGGILIEKQLDWCVRPPCKEHGGIVVTQCLDLYGQGLQRSIHVVDYKTGRKQRTNTDAQDSMQAETGAYLIWQQPEYAEVDVIHWWFYETRFGTKAYAKFERNAEHPRLPHLTTEKAIRERIQSAVQLFLDESRECWPEEKKCAYCDVISLCPNAHMNAKEVADDPKGFVDNLVVMIEYVKRKKTALTKYLRGHGTVAGSKVVFGKKAPSTDFRTEFRAPDRDMKPVDDKHKSHFN